MHIQTAVVSIPIKKSPMLSTEAKCCSANNIGEYNDNVVKYAKTPNIRLFNGMLTV